jgi:hypothetical protein
MGRLGAIIELAKEKKAKSEKVFFNISIYFIVNKIVLWLKVCTINL